MKILHTADWHLGHALRDWPREWEHQQFLAWLLDTLEAEQIDALLVCGDVFDSTNPSAASQLQWYRFLAQTRRRCPGLQVVVIGGNHDAAGRLEAPNPILAALDIDVVGALPRQLDPFPERLLVPLKARGEVRAWAAAVPFLRPADLPRVEGEGENFDPLIEGVRQVYRGALDALRQRASADQAIVAMGHAYMVGGAISELSERKVLGGNQHALPVDVFGDDVTYAALGHLHLAQRVRGNDHVRYAGSPIPLSISEASYTHQVSIVELEGKGLRAIRSLPVPRAVDVLRVPAHGALPVVEVVAALQRLDAPASRPPEAWPFLDVAVEVTAPVPGLIKVLEDALQGKGVRLVRVVRHGRSHAPSLGESLGATSLHDLTPEQVFRERYRREFKDDPGPHLLDAFAELVDLAHRGRGLSRPPRAPSSASFLPSWGAPCRGERRRERPWPSPRGP